MLDLYYWYWPKQALFQTMHVIIYDGQSSRIFINPMTDEYSTNHTHRRDGLHASIWQRSMRRVRIQYRTTKDPSPVRIELFFFSQVERHFRTTSWVTPESFFSVSWRGDGILLGRLAGRGSYFSLTMTTPTGARYVIYKNTFKCAAKFSRRNESCVRRTFFRRLLLFVQFLKWNFKSVTKDPSAVIKGALRWSGIQKLKIIFKLDLTERQGCCNGLVSV